MKPYFLAAALLFACSPPANGQQQSCLDKLDVARTNDEQRPLIVLLESDPWAMVIGPDSPRLALYNDGLVIYRSDAAFKSVKLNQLELSKFKASLNIGALACVLGKYEASDATDQATETIFVGRGGNLGRVSVYGAPEVPAVPAVVISAYERLTKFDHPTAGDWIPASVEVMIWPYEYAPEASVIWPKQWPGLNSPKAAKRGEGYSIYLPATEYPRLIELLKSRKEKGAIEIGGKKWAADVRFPFPHEEEWMTDLAEGH